MSKNSWPKITKTKNHGKDVYLVDSRIAGKGERKFFATKAQADGFAQSCRVRRENEGGSAFNDRELARHGWTVARAIQFALDHLNRQAKSVPVAEAIDKLISAKAASGRQEDYCDDLRRRLTRFSKFAEEKNIAAFTAPDIESFLTSLNVAAGTWNTYRRDLVTLWSYSMKAGYVSSNEAQKTERASDIDKPPGILTPEQAAGVLTNCKDADVLAFHAIGLFACLRVSEIKKLDWKDVDLEHGHIHVSAATSKTRSRRLVPILPNLAEWLQPIAQTEGKITGSNFRRRAYAARAAAGVIPWPDNAMRHSFVSYRLTDTGNAAQTALESGHDQAVLFAHYRKIVKPAAAKKFFEIRHQKTQTT